VAGELKIEGEAELIHSLDGLKGDLRDMAPIHAKIADDLAAEIGRLAPRLTGRLAASFSGTGTADKAEASSELVYAPVQEYGSPGHNIEGQHYAERALAIAQPKIESDYSGGVDKLCRKAEA
jgi:hypothetical protein